MRTVVYTGTRNVYEDMVVACKSLLFHRGADRVIFMVEDDWFPDVLPGKVQVMNVRDQEFFRKDGPNYHNPWTYMTLMKMAVPFLLSGRVLVLDIDTVVDGSLDGLWALPPAPVWMAREVGRVEEYYNCGVVLMDCETFAADAERIIEMVNRERLQFCEQDAINRVMAGRIRQLPAEYNVSGWTVAPESGNAIIRHYAAVRHWQSDARWQKYARMDWDEVV